MNLTIYISSKLRSFLIVFGLGLLVVTLASCRDYLNTIPDSTIELHIDSEEKIAELLTGAYPTASYFPFLEARTDNVGERVYGTHTRLNESMFFWEDDNQEDIDTPLNYWNDCYRGIAQVNKALELLVRFPKTDRVKALYGEAFMLRAYLHFMLVNIWAEPYAGNSVNEMGIPYMEKPEKHAIVGYERGTVREVYEKIEMDLKRGVGLIDDRYYRVPRFHFTKRAAYAFATRFYLMKGDWQNVVDYANYVLGDDAKKDLRRWMDYRKKLHLNFKAMHNLYLMADEPANILLATTQSRMKRTVSTDKYGLTTDKMISIFAKRGIEGGGDYEKLNLMLVYPLSRSEEPVNDGNYMSKFDEFTRFGTTSSSPKDLYVTNVLFSTDEVMLNRMEALAMLERYDDAIRDLLDYLNVKFEIVPSLPYEVYLQSSRDNYTLYSPYYGLNRKQLALVSTILHLRQKEFVHEGLRWFDIRRFHMPVTRTSKSKQYKPLEKDDLRKVLQIPDEAIRRGLQPNPRTDSIIIR